MADLFFYAKMTSVQVRIDQRGEKLSGLAEFSWTIEIRDGL
jgi:hypothetical protein